jgi:uncharacterized membrane protein
MRSRAALGNHPLHPVLVTIPIGSFFLALVGDVAFGLGGARLWFDLSRASIGLGLLFAVAAAVAGAVDYFSVKMSAKAFRTATRHALLNLAVVALYTISFFLRHHEGATSGPRWLAAAAVAFVAFALLAVSGWLGGRLVFEHRVGVYEPPRAVPSPRAKERAVS